MNCHVCSYMAKYTVPTVIQKFFFCYNYIYCFVVAPVAQLKCVCVNGPTRVCVRIQYKARVKYVRIAGFKKIMYRPTLGYV